MLVGNQEAQKLLQSYLDLFMTTKGNVPSFFILSGPGHIGKSAFVQELGKKYLGDFFYNDFLHIKDLSNELGKKHTLKVEYDKGNEMSKTLQNDFQYIDLGVREITSRLQQSYIGRAKILLLENIERMNIESANAFLKSCEEPLPGRVIIATTSHASHLIDTIISRSLIIHFNELSKDELLAFADEEKLFLNDPELKELACDMAMGKPGVLIQLHELLSNDDELKKQFNQIIPLLTDQSKLFQAHAILKNFKKNGIFESFLDGRIAYCTDHNLSSQGKQWLKVKRMMRANVNIEHLMLYGIL